DLHRWASGEFPAGELAESDTLDIVDFEQLLTKRATRIVMRDVNGTAEEFAAAVDRLGLHEVSYSVGWSNWLDIAPDGTSKASGLELVAAELGIDREHTVGAGDGLNDLEMIEWVGHSIVMGQARTSSRPWPPWSPVGSRTTAWPRRWSIASTSTAPSSGPWAPPTPAPERQFPGRPPRRPPLGRPLNRGSRVSGGRRGPRRGSGRPRPRRPPR